jgi:hypothetical protein
MRFVYLGPGVCIPLPSDPTSRWQPLRFRSWFPPSGSIEDFHLQVSAPCRAHHKKRGLGLLPSPRVEGTFFTSFTYSPFCPASPTYSLWRVSVNHGLDMIITIQDRSVSASDWLLNYGAAQTRFTSRRYSQGDPVGLWVSGLVVQVTSSIIPSLPSDVQRRNTPTPS